MGPAHPVRVAGIQRDVNVDVETVTRIEVIDHDAGGRAYVRTRARVRLSYQDQGRTLKVFVNGS